MAVEKNRNMEHCGTRETKIFISVLVYLSNRPQVSMGYRLTTRDVGRTREEFVNHEP